MDATTLTGRRRISRTGNGAHKFPGVNLDEMMVYHQTLDTFVT